MDAAQIARRFPLVARPRPPCRPLTERIREISDLAHTAERDGDLASAAAAQNKAALIASDCGLPDLARTLCWRQAELHLQAQPLDAKATRHALEPLVNLARLHIRAGDGETAYHLLETLFQAVASRSDTVIDGRHLCLRDLTATDGDHRALLQWLWAVVLADGTRALAGTGRWQAALAQAEKHKGVGHRLLDGRQVAILAHLLADDPNTALTLIRQSTPSEPWEHPVQDSLTVLCLFEANLPTGSAVTAMVSNYLALPDNPSLVVFHARLGMTVVDLAAETEQHDNAARAAARLIRETVTTGDGYAAREVLAHAASQTRLRPAEQNALAEAVQSSGLGRGAIPDNLLADLLAVMQMSPPLPRRQSAPSRPGSFTITR